MAGQEHDKGPMLMGVMWSLSSLATVIVIARIFIRQVVLRNLGLDDWLIGIAMILGLLYVVTTTISVAAGYGQHFSALPPDTRERALIWNVISFIFGILSFATPKLGVAALLTRLLNPSRLHRMIIWGLVAVVTAVALMNIIIYITTCDPPQALWKTELALNGQASCRDVWILINYATFNGVLSGFVDMFLAIYPSTVLFKLQMSLRKKIALSTVLGLGSIAVAIAVVKCVQLKGLADKSDPTCSLTGTRTIMKTKADITDATVPLAVWTKTNVESNIVLLASCIPTLQPLLDIILGKRKLSSYSRSHTCHENYQQGSGSRTFWRDRRTAAGKQALTITTLIEHHSQENILPAQDTRGPLHIHRTDDVTVEYEMQTKSPSVQKDDAP
ncbi:uncharacterized protein BDW43DRAFT_15389 [Aspergillus alliaceus]|uniref:uncharacterized protein n=1 Tax=Petromyces alliaceus TaxID=209559 RepID=UPI0012A6675E|nr:uncharacterized protein BDW43DRAFT_15389 [Aspergillus alliaceus]KAB8235890.1 hypothetical protein BDW43DRAFT_15389 [Aspergillus alliaceus]